MFHFGKFLAFDRSRWGALRIAAPLFAVVLAFQNCSGAVFGGDDKVVDDPSLLSSPSVRYSYYRAVCSQPLSPTALPLAPGGQIGNTSGSLILTVSSASLVHDISGSVLIRASSPGARIDRIENVSGSVILCGVSVGGIKDIGGSLLIIDGDLGSVENVTGSVLVGGGQVIGPVSGSGGSIVALP